MSGPYVNFCPSCNVELEDDDSYCPTCFAPTGAASRKQRKQEKVRKPRPKE